MKFTRRRSLLTGVGAIASAVPGWPLTVVRAIAATLPPQTPSTLSATVTLGGKTYLYDSAVGIDLGDYAGPGFMQRCIKVSRSDCPLSVCFRPDRDSSRREVVFEISEVVANAPPPDLPAYTTSIREGTQVLATVAVPRHYGYSRWRWQSASRPVVNSIANLIASGALPKYGPTRNTLGTPPQYGYDIMGIAGVSPDMGATGERDDIGPVTEQQGYYIVTGEGLSTVLAQGEACGTLQWHRRKNDSPINLDNDPNASCFWTNLSGGSWYPGSQNSGVKLEFAHVPALSFLPFMLTGDPYYLEELQFQTNQAVLDMNPAYRQGATMLLRDDQTRGYAWSLRSLLQVAAFTPPATPSWLLPKSYWLAKLENNRRHFVAKWLKQSPFGIGPTDAWDLNPPGQASPWQEDFLTFILFWGVRMGHSAWRPIADWKNAATIARTNGQSGWPRAWCSPYRQIINASTWTESWAETQIFLGYELPSADVIADGEDPNYVGYTRAVLAAAGGGDQFQWIDAAMATKGWGVRYKWSVVL